MSERKRIYLCLVYMSVESGGQELLYKSLETIYSLKNRYLSVA